MDVVNGGEKICKLPFQYYWTIKYRQMAYVQLRLHSAKNISRIRMENLFVSNLLTPPIFGWTPNWKIFTLPMMTILKISNHLPPPSFWKGRFNLQYFTKVVKQSSSLFREYFTWNYFSLNFYCFFLLQNEPDLRKHWVHLNYIKENSSGNMVFVQK